MTMPMSRRGQEYLETAQSLLRAARTTTDVAVAARLEMLANDFQRRAEKASSADAARASTRAAASTGHEWYP
ncbi:hypothetical protein [Bradyrhizobium sp. McL0616]|uniref:hypothetical protein n=1 Tax=Bradyrhizobium sp. McL0616 TaxID=3415674 RepID=UPI003CE72135